MIGYNKTERTPNWGSSVHKGIYAEKIERLIKHNLCFQFMMIENLTNNKFCQ
ncbi:hypothetical protein Hanom_Chr01g00086291 [Helianthus anomalus]